jgi:hypothetical protein
MSARLALAAMLVLAGAPCLQADLQKVMAEKNLEKRSKLALENAKAAYQAARDAYQKGDMDKVQALANEIDQSVQIAYQSLVDTGKDPRRSSHYFKSAEIETRDLARRLDGFQEELNFDERPILDKAKARVQKVHDDLLLGLMEGKKK